MNGNNFLYMKTIKLDKVEIKEITIVPNTSLSVLYRVLDDLGNVIINNRITVLKEDLPLTGQTAMDNLVAKILTKIEQKEL